MIQKINEDDDLQKLRAAQDATTYRDKYTTFGNRYNSTSFLGLGGVKYIFYFYLGKIDKVKYTFCTVLLGPRTTDPY